MSSNEDSNDSNRDSQLQQMQQEEGRTLNQQQQVPVNDAATSLEEVLFSLDSTATTHHGSSRTITESNVNIGPIDHHQLLSTDQVVNVLQNANQSEFDAILAKELNQLSVKERDEAIYEVHGVKSNMIDESNNPELVQDKLDKVEQYLNNKQDVEPIGKGLRDAYDRALYMSPELYIHDGSHNCQNDQTLRVTFLRSTCFNVREAVMKYLQHFTCKLQLFGEELLTKPMITWNDLDIQDQLTVQSGFIQVLPIRDRSNRAVICFIPQLLPPSNSSSGSSSSIKSKLRAAWYIGMSICHDVETQNYGCVFISFNIDRNQPFSFEQVHFMKQVVSVRKGLPYRVVGAHYCYTNPLLYPFIAFTTYLLGKHVRQRFRTHYGGQSHNNYIYELQTYGIPTEVLPINVDKENDQIVTTNLEYHLDWLQRIQRFEQQEGEYAVSTSLSDGEGEKDEALSTQPRNNEGDGKSDETESLHTPLNKTKQPSPAAADRAAWTTTPIILPRRFDVLFGRGSRIAEHSGNLRAMHIVEMHRERYEKALKFQKTQIAESIVTMIQKSYGRFLKREPGIVNGNWILATQDEARDKISHFFRRLRELDAKSSASSGLTQNRLTEPIDDSAMIDSDSSRNKKIGNAHQQGMKRPNASDMEGNTTTDPSPVDTATVGGEQSTQSKRTKVMPFS